MPPGGAPSPPGSLGGAFVSRPRAPHPHSTIKTPHDSALVEQDACNLRPLKATGISYFSKWEVIHAAEFFGANAPTRLALLATLPRKRGRDKKESRRGSHLKRA